MPIRLHCTSILYLERQDHLWGRPPSLLLHSHNVQPIPHSSSELKWTNIWPSHSLEFGVLMRQMSRLFLRLPMCKNSSQGVESTWACTKVFWLLVWVAASPALYSAPGPPNCCSGPRCRLLCWVEQRSLQKQNKENEVNTHAHVKKWKHRKS
jgi:hypothetical protein